MGYQIRMENDESFEQKWHIFNVRHVLGVVYTGNFIRDLHANLI
jgi:hypothetical protein